MLEDAIFRGFMDAKVLSHRLRRSQALMEGTEVDLMALTPGPNMTYMTGFREEPGERLLTALVPREGDMVLVVPKLYAEQVEKSTGMVDFRVWTDSEDPRVALSGALGGLPPPRRVALDTRMWALFVLMFQETLPDAELIDASRIMNELRIIKGEEELEIMRRAFRATDKATGMIVESLREGMTERQVADVIRSSLSECGSDAPSFMPIAASGPNGSQPHYRFGDRRLQRGDAVVLDYGGVFRGYYTDVARTVFVGAASAEQSRVYEVVRRANDAAVEAATAEKPAEIVDAEARKTITEAGYGERFIHRTGHGIGLEGHEEPYIVSGNKRPLEDGMTFSVEPGIYLPGRFGVRIEDIVYLAGGRANRFDEYTRDLLII